MANSIVDFAGFLKESDIDNFQAFLLEVEQYSEGVVVTTSRTATGIRFSAPGVPPADVNFPISETDDLWSALDELLSEYEEAAEDDAWGDWDV